MSPEFLLTQLLNGVQYGVLLFLMAAGLTLVFGIMNFINLAHGSLYMMGAYFAALAYGKTESFLLAIVAGAAGLFVLAVLLDRIAFSALHRRDHLDQVLATFGLVLFANEAVRFFWGSAPLFMDVPGWLSQPVQLLGFNYPAYRGAIIVVGLGVAFGLHLLIDRTRIGMLIRAGASNRQMVSALGVNIAWLTTFIFALGAALAGLAGAMVGPILSIQPGMGEPILILTLVVIVIGGIGSVRGALFGALIVGIVDTLGRGVLPGLLFKLFDPAIAAAAGPALASVGVYLLMAAVLALKPEGLFPTRHS
ncbi:branched-chain amino acid ABC transporter permease [Variovorax sp. J22P271]|uniref:branched-chain amino acid ABC transporter permease n=1 Tax=Variovorax davisae TaxID=3053515 RepID=UPI0025756D46|nr:branched-chain amino acid ABC transporter permease [Variovorax sp. J22P271]MDM0033780.1 branched-chain amino acid ABC transporter permease [Variovorax sp. J22P271]